MLSVKLSLPTTEFVRARIHVRCTRSSFKTQYGFLPFMFTCILPHAPSGNFIGELCLSGLNIRTHSCLSEAAKARRCFLFLHVRGIEVMISPQYFGYILEGFSFLHVQLVDGGF